MIKNSERVERVAKKEKKITLETAGEMNTSETKLGCQFAEVNGAPEEKRSVNEQASVNIFLTIGSNDKTRFRSAQKHVKDIQLKYFNAFELALF